MKPYERVYCAIDTTDIDKAVSLAKTLIGHVGGFKLGLEFFMANGSKGFEAVAKTGMPIFLDLKFHDIPNTVAGAIRAVAPLGPKLMTIHTQGGPEMMRRAQETATQESAKHGLVKPWVIGVTILTSLDGDDIAATGLSDDVETSVRRLAKLAKSNTLDGIVCSPKEISLVRSATDANFKLIVPGIRPTGSAAGDQKRVMTPKAAVEAGADILVIGRPITLADNPLEAAKAIANSLKV